MDYLERSLGMTRIQRVRNEEDNRIMQIEDSIAEIINNKPLTWYRHVCRMPENQESVVDLGKVDRLIYGGGRMQKIRRG